MIINFFLVYVLFAQYIKEKKKGIGSQFISQATKLNNQGIETTQPHHQGAY